MSDPLPINPPFLSREEIAERQEKRHQILRRLDDRDSTVRQQAIRECQSLPAQEICALMNMSRETKGRVLSTYSRYVLAFFMGIACFTCIPVAVLQHTILVTIISFFAGTFILLMSVYMAERQVAVYSDRVGESFLEIVRGAQDPAFLPEAMRLLYTGEYSANKFTPLGVACYENAYHWLLHLNNEEIRAFAIQQQAFCQLLRLELVMKNVELSIRILAYLERYGTHSAIPTVETLTRTIVFSDKQRVVKIAAYSCLTALEQRARESRQPETLLRASSAPSDTPAVLLRPADGSANDTLPAQLLRSADGGKT